MDVVAFREVMRSQGGVVARRQALASGFSDNDIERSVRRREWAVVHPGVYVDHTGPLRWHQRAWAAVLALQPAALAGPSALRAHGLVRSLSADRMQTGDEAPIHVAVDRHRHVKAPVGVILVRRSRLEDLAQLHLSPPRLRLEEALVDVADAAQRECDAIALLADACQVGRTTARRILVVVERRSRLRRRRLLTEVLGEVQLGVRSVLEHRFVREVERPHGLPTGHRQRRVATRRGATYRDVEYRAQAIVVELDGRLVHATDEARWDDLERDIDAAAAGEFTVRLGWRHVVDPCRTAAALVRLLRARGWREEPRPCSPGCPVGTEVSGRRTAA